MTEATPFPLGRVIEHDPRSRSFPAHTSSQLKTVTHRFYQPVLDQGSTGSCTGHAMAHALNTVPLRHGRKLLTENDAQMLYHMATVLDSFPGEWPPDDVGSSGLAVAKAAQGHGLISRYTHAFGIEQALAALVLTPIIIGIDWFNWMFKPDPKGYLHLGGSVAGGHEIAVIGINTRLQRVTILNSWGPGWGINGRAHLTFTDLNTLLNRDGDATVPVL